MTLYDLIVIPGLSILLLCDIMLETYTLKKSYFFYIRGIFNNYVDSPHNFIIGNGKHIQISSNGQLNKMQEISWKFSTSKI